MVSSSTPTVMVVERYHAILKPFETVLRLTFHRRKMSTHALQKMARDRFRVMSLALRQKCLNVVEMKEAMAAFLVVTTLQFLATVRDQKLFWSKF